MEAIEIIKEKIINEDIEFFNSVARKNQGWRVKDWIYRKLTFEFGTIRVKIRKYVRKIDNKYENYNVCLSLFKDIKNKNIGFELRKKVISLYLNGLSYRKIAKNYGISHTEIFKIVKNHFPHSLKEAKIINFKEIITKNENIYIAVDDTYLKVRQGQNEINKIKARIINFFALDKNKKPYCKNHLIYFSSPNRNMNLNDLVEKINSVIRNNYSEEANIIITGDGAKWIRTLSKKLSARYILCKFHLHSKFQVIFNHSNHLKKELEKLEKITKFNLFNILYTYLKNHKYIEIFNLVSKHWDSIKKCLNEKRAKLLHDFAYYVHLNITGLSEIEECDKNYYGNIAESYVSHIIKSKTKKFYSICNIKTIIQRIINPYDYIKNNIEIHIID
ncbi:Mbov_0401 family ICE element transposase-like protein [Metamycoplasma hominis]|uniref:Mbov_0401 family ICE element transposase-like protein n=1 Tax=Metamycoplasma hominis TaxID=2098 RepID=UPI00158C6B34|nr:UPF0236 family protein [Metamycoplasma hominis]QKX41279.1 UPF0236 family protein [Metamycoplasma hominis]